MDKIIGSGLVLIAGLMLFMFVAVTHEKAKLQAEKEAKPTKNISFEDAKMYAAGFEMGYNTAVLESMNVALDANGDIGLAMMKDLTEKSKAIKENHAKR